MPTKKPSKKKRKIANAKKAAAKKRAAKVAKQPAWRKPKKRVVTKTTTVTTTTTTVSGGELKTRIAIVLDNSSSMQSIRQETIDMFNKQVDTIKESAEKLPNTTVSLFTFDYQANEPKLFNVPANFLQYLSSDSYRPCGNTAMYDSVGMAIERLSGLAEAEEAETSFLVIVISDGYENASRFYSSERLAEAIRRCQETNRWTFSYLGANQDLSKVSASLNIPIHNTMSFAANSAGMRGATIQTQSATEMYMANRACGVSAVQNFYAGANQQKADPAKKKP